MARGSETSESLSSRFVEGVEGQGREELDVHTLGDRALEGDTTKLVSGEVVGIERGGDSSSNILLSLVFGAMGLLCRLGLGPWCSNPGDGVGGGVGPVKTFEALPSLPSTCSLLAQ